jgi:hypothetical protein
MWRFIENAPLYIIGAYLTTFTITKIFQSEILYRYVTTKIDVWRAKQVRKVRLAMGRDLSWFLAGRREQDLSPREQEVYFAMLESYYNRIEQLYGKEENYGIII